jgi:NADPH:quinone reductase-like Zn-dependent oxidoreductase
VHVDRVFPLAEIAAAHQRLEAGQQLGKIVLAIPERDPGPSPG